MDWEALLVSSGIVSAVVAAVIAAVNSWYIRRDTHRLEKDLETIKARLQTRSTIDLALRDARLAAYQELWCLTGKLPQWPRAAQPAGDDLMYEDLRKFSQDLRDWYFSKGGWLLSVEARKAYTPVQESLWNDVGGVLWDTHADGSRHLRHGPVSERHYDQIRERCHELRNELTKDLHSRLAAPVLDDQDASLGAGE